MNEERENINKDEIHSIHSKTREEKRRESSSKTLEKVFEKKRRKVQIRLD